jgi:hypothetical protein
MKIFYDDYGLRAWVVVTIGVLFVLSFFLILIIGIYFLELKTCQETAESMGLQWDYGFWIPCLVSDGGGWVDIDNYQAVQKFKEIKE